MVEVSKRYLTDTAEERLARRVVERFELSPPIDVAKLVRLYAELEEVDFPVQIDGVSLNIKHRAKPAKVLVSSSLPITRKRFTIAHEIGHVLIPWHVGSIVDDVAAGNSNSAGRYREKEAEANRFAAELLMPYDWSYGILKQEGIFTNAIQRIAHEAMVSLEAASFRAQRIGPPNIIVAVANGGKITRSGRTPGTRANIPKIGSAPHAETVDPCDHYSVLTMGEQILHAWKTGQALEVPKRPKKSSAELLDEIIADLKLEHDKKVKMSVHGIISVANGSVREERTIEKVYAAIFHNIKNRNDRKEVIAVLKHKKFHKFVAARVHDFKI